VRFLPASYRPLHTFENTTASSWWNFIISSSGKQVDKTVRVMSSMAY